MRCQFDFLMITANIQKYNWFIYIEFVSNNYSKFIYSNNLFIDSSRFPSKNNDSSFLLLHLYSFYFSCLIQLAKTFSTILAKGGDSGHP